MIQLQPIYIILVLCFNHFIWSKDDIIICFIDLANHWRCLRLVFLHIWRVPLLWSEYIVFILILATLAHLKLLLTVGNWRVK